MKRYLSPTRKISWIVFATLISVFLILYIIQINKMNQTLYLIESYEKKIEELAEENEILEIQLSRLNGLKTIESLVRALNFEPTEKVHYIKILDDSIVTK